MFVVVAYWYVSGFPPLERLHPEEISALPQISGLLLASTPRNVIVDEAVPGFVGVSVSRYGTPVFFMITTVSPATAVALAFVSVAQGCACVPGSLSSPNTLST